MKHLENHKNAEQIESNKSATKNESSERKNSENIYGCDKCSKTFRYPSNLAKHYKHHVIESVIFRRQKFRHKNINTNSMFSPHTCPYCTQVFIHKFNLRKHINQSHNQENRENSQNMDNANNISNLSDISHKCDKCGKSFPTEKKCSTHKNTHSDTRFYLCNICGKTSKKTFLQLFLYCIYFR